MNTLRLIIVAGILTCTLNGCKNCSECTKYPGKAREICKKDYGSEATYNAVYRQMIADGYKCD